MFFRWELQTEITKSTRYIWKGRDYLKTKTINQIIEAYKQNDLEECEGELFFLMLLYNEGIQKGEVYDHGLKHILFKTNFIRNPIGMKLNRITRSSLIKILLQELNYQYLISYLKYFTNPYVDAIEVRPGNATIQNLKSIWEKGYPDANEFMEYLLDPVTTHPFSNYMEKQFTPVPGMDEKDCAIFSEDYMLIDDPIKAEVLKEEKDVKKIYQNAPCPCGSGRKYKKCCNNKAKM